MALLTNPESSQGFLKDRTSKNFHSKLQLQTERCLTPFTEKISTESKRKRGRGKNQERGIEKAGETEIIEYTSVMQVKL